MRMVTTPTITLVRLATKVAVNSNLAVHTVFLGYSVEIGRFVNSSTYWGVTAAPRAKGLLGQVINKQNFRMLQKNSLR